MMQSCEIKIQNKRLNVSENKLIKHLPLTSETSHKKNNNNI